MKKLLVILLSAALITLPFGTRRNITLLGDSIASGYGLEGYEQGNAHLAKDSFGSLLAKEYQGDYKNLAVDGRTTSDLLSALETDISEIHDGDTVILSIGGNDLLQPFLSAVQSAVLSDAEMLREILSGNSVPDMPKLFERYSDIAAETIGEINLEQSIRNIESIVGKISSSKKCRLYILTVYNPFEGVPGIEKLSDFAAEKIDALNAAIKSLDGITAVDVNAEFKGKSAELTNILYADIHPNAAGHKVIFNLLCEEISKAP